MRIERPKSLTELVVEELRRRIIDGRLELGAALSENTLAAELGMSKTPVREALLQLRQDRLVEILPQKGTYVFRLAADHVVMISELREILEVAAAAAALARSGDALVATLSRIYGEMEQAERDGDTVAYRTLDGEFHQAMVDLAGNPYLTDAYSQIGFRIQALRSRLSAEAALNRLSLRDHRDLVAHARGGDVASLQRLLRAHIAQTKDSYLVVLGRREALAS